MKYTLKQYLKFIIPSSLGLFLFLFPIKHQGNWTIPYGIVAEYIEIAFKNYWSYLIALFLVISLTLSVLYNFIKPTFLMKSPTLERLSKSSKFDLFMRLLAVIFIIMVLTKQGPNFIINKNTGSTALEILELVVPWLIVACFVMPLLLQFGIMELTGILVRDFMRPLFKVPGRATLDCLASFIGSGTVGILITNTQFKEGYYTRKETNIISTCFSLISISFCIVIVKTIGIYHLFFPMYATVVGSSLIAAMILPRIYPLKSMPDTYYENSGKKIDEEILKGESKFEKGLHQAIKKADSNKSFIRIIYNSFLNIIDLFISLNPLIISIATIALIFTEYTSIFEILSTPLVPILEFLKIPEALKAAPALFVGFIDLFLPVIIGKGVESEMTKFIIACLSATQLIFMTETGPIILRSGAGLKFKDLLIIFFERTIITLPIIIIVAKLML